MGYCHSWQLFPGYFLDERKIQNCESHTLKSKKLILLVAATTGYQTRAFAEAARDLKIELILATDRCHVLDDPWGDHAIALKFDQPEESVAALTSLKVDGVVGLGDRQSWIAALAAEMLRVPFHPADAALTAIDKNLARQSMAAAGLPVPDYYVVP